ncbi:hypothetical protein SAMN05216311_101152 [Chitinophaga sp. CF418]|nr:hypothetical protein SAMN05216311_101152 [Chitinophaga sp. CF418]
MFVFRGTGIASGAISSDTTCFVYSDTCCIKSIRLKIMLNKTLNVQQEKIDAGKAKIQENRFRGSAFLSRDISHPKD